MSAHSGLDPRGCVSEHTFVPTDQNPNHRGAISELAIVLQATKAGFEVYRPSSEHARADMVFGMGSQVFRVQVKTASVAGDVLRVPLVSSWYSPGGYVRRSYTAAEVDLVAAYCPERESAYLLPIALVGGMRMISLRLGPPRNGQRAGLHYAADYEFHGAVAQLEERRHGMAEARGSSPLSSTSKDAGNASTIVGAHEFRNHFGWYLERAAAGETIDVTRHGNAHVRLGPVTPPLIDSPGGEDAQAA
jgi:prevent-host-death family protein